MVSIGAELVESVDDNRDDRSGEVAGKVEIWSRCFWRLLFLCSLNSCDGEVLRW